MPLDVPSLAPKWTLTRIEPEPQETLTGQFPIEGADEFLSTQWVDVAMPNSSLPISQWMHAQPSSLNITTTLYARTPNDDIRDRLDKIKQWMEVDPRLARPPRVRFRSGDLIFNGVITQLRVRYSEPWHELRGGLGVPAFLPPTISQSAAALSAQFAFKKTGGRLKRADIELTLREIATPPAPQPYDPERPTAGSRFHVARDGETFEQIANDEYSDPMVGVLLAQDHPFVFPQSGNVVYLPSRQVYERSFVAPMAYSLGGANDAQTRLRELIDSHLGSTTVPL